MRIVLLSAEYPPNPGGVGDYTQCLGNALVARSQDVAIWTIRDRRLYTIDPHTSEQIGMPIAPASWSWECWGAIRAGLRRIRPDILHIQYQTGAYGMHPAINLLPLRLALDSQRPRLLVTAHDLLLPYLLPKAGVLRKWVTQRLFEDCDATIVTNQEDFAATTGIADHVADTTPRFVGKLKQQPYVIPIGSNITPTQPFGYDRFAWRSRLSIGPDTTLVAYFGLISPTKGLDLLLDALEQLPEKIKLLIIGGDSPAPQDHIYAEQLRERIQATALRTRVLMTGHCSPTEVSAHLMAADIVALPFTDGATFRRGSLLAALAHGLPVITTEPQNRRTKNQEPLYGQRSEIEYGRLGMQRYLIPDHNALLIPIGDTGALVAHITRLAGDPTLRTTLAAGARELAAHFSWEGIAERHVALYEQILQQA